MEDTFEQYRLELDPATKHISASTYSSPTFQAELLALNDCHRSLIKDLEPGQAVPPPPVPLNPKRSQMIQKMKEQGNAAVSKKAGSPAAQQQAYNEALKCYNIAIEMALKRPLWEPSGIVREEAALLFSNRAQAQLGLQNWVEASVDAETSIEMKAAPGQGKAWWRKVKALMEMGRWDEAETWVGRALGIEPQGESAGELRVLQGEVAEALRRRAEARA